jgi:hypothetical protein
VEEGVNWEKEHQVRGRRTKLHLIRLVEDVETILIIVKKGSVPIVALEKLLNYVNLVGEIDIAPLMAIKVFIDKWDIFVFI